MGSSLVSVPGRRGFRGGSGPDLEELSTRSSPASRSLVGTVSRTNSTPSRRTSMMPIDAMSWLLWAMVAGLVVLLWASALLLARTVLPGRPRRARDERSEERRVGIAGET